MQQTRPHELLTRNGDPVAELRPVQARRFDPRAGIAEAAARAAGIDARVS